MTSCSSSSFLNVFFYLAVHGSSRFSVHSPAAISAEYFSAQIINHILTVPSELVFCHHRLYSVKKVIGNDFSRKVLFEYIDYDFRFFFVDYKPFVFCLITVKYLPAEPFPFFQIFDLSAPYLNKPPAEVSEVQAKAHRKRAMRFCRWKRLLSRASERLISALRPYFKTETAVFR